MPKALTRRALVTLAAGGMVAVALTACGGASHAAPAAPTPSAPAIPATETAAHDMPMGAAAAPAPADAATATPVATNAITIDNFAFAPMAITVKAGTTVTWTNHDEEPHSVVSSDEPMRSPTLAGPNNTVTHTFTKPGRYNFNCGIHPFMHGTVEVTA